MLFLDKGHQGSEKLRNLPMGTQLEVTQPGQEPGLWGSTPEFLPLSPAAWKGERTFSCSLPHWYSEGLCLPGALPVTSVRSQNQPVQWVFYPFPNVVAEIQKDYANGRKLLSKIADGFLSQSSRLFSRHQAC